MRIPSSRVRWVTLNAITPYKPILARQSARPAKTPSSVIVRRRENKTLADVFLHRRDLGDGLIGVERYDLFLDRTNKRMRIPTRLRAHYQSLFVLRKLRRGKIHHR